MRVLAFTNSYHFDFILLLFLIFLLGGCKCCLALSSCFIVPLLFSVVLLYCLLWN